ncbi:hypothetical protein [Silvibacterium bohemicum]|uniref:hypothetical protein n=1 Tax=Silvibacterium bohemicum TaxID=1577686 RepID=UPI001E436B5C|nr:hypothetical protein [Silvibacterium bohemicum]
MQTKMKFGMRSLLHVAAVAGLVSVVPLSSAFAGQTGDEAADHAEAQAREAWRGTMHKLSTPGEGCFHASYPSTQWEEVECAEAPGYRSALPKAKVREQTVGNGSDYVVQAPSGSLLSAAAGSFPTVTGVKTEKSAGVAAFGDGGILGSNEYTLQVNTNFDSSSAACNGYSGCFAWQQYVMSTNTPVSLTSNQLTNKTEVFIEYWLINYGVDNGSNICPSGFIDGGADAEGPGDDCVQNTKATVIANGQLPITDLASLKLSGSAKAGGTDAATVTFDTEAYTATVSDSLTDIASGWTQAEFNVLGNAGGSVADFNTGSSVTVNVAVTDGSTTAPTCISPSKDDGTTGETNNLTLGKCTATGGATPSIQFTESH